MRSFREFLIEAKLPPMPSGQLSGHLGLPDLNKIKLPGQRPEGGYDSWAQMAQSSVEKQREGDLYKKAKIFEKIRALAEMARSAELNRIAGKQHNPLHGTFYQSSYHTALYDKGQDAIFGLAEEEIIGGNYPRLNNQDMNIGVQEGILVKNTSEDSWILYVGVLRQKMMELKQALAERERGYEQKIHLAGQADKILGMMGGSGKVRNLAADQYK
jgi:hypothetical protein